MIPKIPNRKPRTNPQKEDLFLLPITIEPHNPNANNTIKKYIFSI